MKRHICFVAAAAGLLLATSSSLVQATPYASGITISGTTVTYILNDSATALDISINGGAFTAAPDGTGKGLHTFTLPSPTATFSIRADKDEQGFTNPTGGNYLKAGTGIAYDTPESTGLYISDTLSPLTKFNSPRGVAVSKDPNAPNFGTVYISNSAASATPIGGRAGNTGKGLYALKADQTDAYAYGDTAQDVAAFAGASANSPYKTFVGTDGTVYTAGFGDGASNVYTSSPDLLTNGMLFSGTTATTDFSTTGTAGCATAGLCLPVGQNHGSVASAYVEGSSAAGNLVVYTLDEDMTTQQLTRVNATDPKGIDNNKLWRYNIGNAALPYSTMPTAVTPTTPLINQFSIIIDLDRGADGKFYVTQNRSQPANASALFVLDANGNVLFDSAKASAKAIPTASTTAGDYNHDGVKSAGDYVIWRKQEGTAGPDADGDGSGLVDGTDFNIWRDGNPALTGVALEDGFGDTFNDLYSNVFAMSVSPDQKWLATLHNNNSVMLTPLVGGIPDVAGRLALAGGANTVSARDIGWDAAGNLHFVSSGLGSYFVLAPGGHTQATTSWNGTSYAFNAVTIPGSGSVAGGAVPEPGTLVLALTGALAVGIGRRRR